jgi:hypothetical protein
VFSLHIDEDGKVERFEDSSTIMYSQYWICLVLYPVLVLLSQDLKHKVNSCFDPKNLIIYEICVAIFKIRNSSSSSTAN